MSLGDTLLQLLFRFIVSTLYGAYLPRSYVGSDGLLRQHFPENVCSAFIIIIIIIITIIKLLSLVTESAPFFKLKNIGKNRLGISTPIN